MSLHEQVSADRVHIGFFGLRNAGKSSLVNQVTGQNMAVVSDVLGTTTDPVKKAMELLPIGPVVIIDTPGYDDEGSLGSLRVDKTREILRKTDIAVLVTDAARKMHPLEEELISLFEERKIPYVTVYNKSDLMEEEINLKAHEIAVSALTGEHIHELKEMLGAFVKREEKEKYIISDLLKEGEFAVLVVPVDESAPKGRLILPQQQTIRDLLDHHMIPVVTQVEELSRTLSILGEKPSVVITDSQAFEKVKEIVPEDIYLTSFSILMARYKGQLTGLLAGSDALDQLKDGDRILISEGCTHHRQCNDIGTVKMPGWVDEYTGKQLSYSFSSGNEFPEDMEQFSLIIHCGGCMLNDKEMAYRVAHAKKAGVPVLNYGMAIAKMNGILDRSLEIMEQQI